MTVGTGALRFEAVPGWPRVPEAAGLIEAIGVAVDSRDRVFVFARAEIPVLIFDADGTFLDGWGQRQFVRPHGIWIAPDDSVWLVDDKGHSVRQFSPEGTLRRTVGPDGVAADSGADGFDYRTIRPGCGPYNLPTNAVTGPRGDLFVTDGYGNARVHHFSPEGDLLASWGEPGSGPGQFQVPHGIGIDPAGRLYVCDRENSRIQIFSPDGELLSIWTDVARPCEAFVTADGLVCVAELGFRTGRFPWHPREPDRTGGRLSLFDPDGTLLARWGGGDSPESPEDFYAPHDVQVDSRGSIYVAEVKTSAASYHGDETSTLPSLRKFVRC